LYLRGYTVVRDLHVRPAMMMVLCAFCLGWKWLVIIPAIAALFLGSVRAAWLIALSMESSLEAPSTSMGLVYVESRPNLVLARFANVGL
jgi:hypothetical protein